MMVALYSAKKGASISSILRHAILSTGIKVDKKTIECIREGAVSFDEIEARFKEGIS